MKDRGFKIVTIAALLIAVLGLSIGYATYTENLKYLVRLQQELVQMHGMLDLKIYQKLNLEELLMKWLLQT